MSRIKSESYKSYLSNKPLLIFLFSAFCVSVPNVSSVQATEPEYGSGSNGQQQQLQNQEQFQSQNQTQRQGDNRVNVDGDDNDYLALAIPNLVAANCAGQSYSLGAGGAGFGFGLGQALIDENCQIAKAIATAHMLQETRLVKLSSYDYLKALCQMRGMEHVCKKKPGNVHHACAGKTKVRHTYPGWCANRVGRDTKPSKWSDRDLKSCGLTRANFSREIDNWGTEEICLPHPSPTVYTETVRPPFVAPPPPAYDVVVRTGEHCGYDRVVFDWPQPSVDYEVKRQDNKVVVKFDRSGEIDVSRVSNTLGRFILSAYSEKHADGTYVTFAVDEGVKHRVWQSDHRVVVDIRKPGCPTG